MILTNHSVSKIFTLQDLKSRLPNIYKKYQDLKSEIKDVIVEDNRIAFHVEQKAVVSPDNLPVTLNILNIYRLLEGKVIEWQLWSAQNTVN